MISNHGYLLLRELMSSKEPISLQELAQRVGVSSRTVWTELNAVENWLGMESQVIRKRGVGISLSLSQEDHRRILRTLEPEKMVKPCLSTDRQQFIFLKLLQGDPKFHSIQSFADALYVSRTSINKDLEEVEKSLQRYGLKLKRRPHYGLQVSGTEENWRRAAVEYLTQVVDKKVLLEVLNENIERSFISSSRIDAVSYQQIRALFPEFDIRVVRKILEDIEFERDLYFTDDNFVSLLIHLLIGLERMRCNKALTIRDMQLQALQPLKEFQVAEEIARRIHEKLNIMPSQAEIGYIALHILGAKIEHGSIDVRLNLQDFDPQLVELAEGIIKVAGDSLKLDLSADKQLKLGLILHLRPVINRIRYGMSLRNPILNGIKEQYPVMFAAAIQAGIFMEEKLKMKVTEEELGYIAMHLGASLERTKRLKRVLVVCGSGIGTSQLIASRLGKLSSEIQVVDIVSAQRLKERCIERKENIDAIVTTIPLIEAPSFPTITVSPLLTERDRQRILEFLNLTDLDNQAETVSFQNRHGPSITRYMDRELTFINSEFQNKSQLIGRLSQELLRRNFVRHGFEESVLQREQFQETSLGNLVAIPHAYSGFIITPKIAVAVLKSPISWGLRDVQVIFMVAVETSIKRECEDFFAQLTHLIYNQKAISRLIDTDNYTDFLLGIEEESVVENHVSGKDSKYTQTRR